MAKQVTVLMGAGRIGVAIARRVAAGGHLVLADFVMRSPFISGTDILIDGGTTASYHYGDLQYLKATH